MNLERPERAKPILKHLMIWGEVAVCELSYFSESKEWLQTLVEASILKEIRKSKGKNLSWVLTSKGEMLLDIDLTTALKSTLFQIDDYRTYLAGILGEGLALAAKAGMQDQIEEWTGRELVMILNEINHTLDAIESEKRLVDQRPETIAKMCTGLPGRNNNWSAWDQLLLGRSGRPQELFDFVLKRFAPHAFIPVNQKKNLRPAILRRIPLNPEEEFDLSQPIVRAPWNIKRHHVKSGITLFEEDGQPCVAMDSLQDRKSALQDTLVEHPVYKAIVQLAIAAWRPPTNDAPTVELYLDTDNALSGITILFSGSSAGNLIDLLPQLVFQQGFTLRSLTNGKIPSSLIENVMANLFSLDVLDRTIDSIALHPEFQASLMANRLRTIFRPGKKLQQRMIKYLQQK